MSEIWYLFLLDKMCMLFLDSNHACVCVCSKRTLLHTSGFNVCKSASGIGLQRWTTPALISGLSQWDFSAAPLFHFSRAVWVQRAKLCDSWNENKNHTEMAACRRVQEPFMHFPGQDSISLLCEEGVQTETVKKKVGTSAFLSQRSNDYRTCLLQHRIRIPLIGKHQFKKLSLWLRCVSTDLMCMVAYLNSDLRGKMWLWLPRIKQI